jgi:two-component sensor histidine kinase
MDGLAADDIVETLRTPVLLLDPHLRVLLVNWAFLRTFGVERDETEGRLIQELGDGQWDIPRLHDLLCEIVTRDTVVEDFEVETRFPRIGRRAIALNARRVRRPGDLAERALVAFEDVTEVRQRERDGAQALAEVYHRVTNSLAVIAGFVQGEARRADGAAAEILSAIEGRIVAVAHLYDLIARSKTRDAVRGDAYLGGLAAGLTASLLGPDSPVRIAVDAEPLHLTGEACVPLGLVVNELATNAVKHAFPDGKAGQIQIALKRQDDMIRLNVADDGVGLGATAASRSATKAKGFGSRYVGLFVRQLGGTLVESSCPGGGTSFDIRLPLAVLAA